MNSQTGFQNSGMSTAFGNTQSSDKNKKQGNSKMRTMADIRVDEFEQD